jgi:signal transduction histidine kinase
MATRIEDQIGQIQLRDTQRRELIASISHDLRTPLASLHGYLETVLVKGEQLSAATRRQYLDTALRHSEQLERLIAALFELSKLEAGAITAHMEQFSIAELLQDIALRFLLRAQQLDVELTTAVDPQARPVCADVPLIERIFENLLDNALSNTPSGGRIDLQMHAAADCVHVRVVDTGRGIAAAELPHVFERYYRGAQQSHDGGGLGLAIVRRIIELHGGSVSIDSAPGKGTAVEFTLSYAHSERGDQSTVAVA